VQGFNTVVAYFGNVLIDMVQDAS